MSEPKRYHHFIKFYSKSFTDVTGARYCYPDAGMIEDKDGKYVEYEDYARLKAEVERLQSIHSIDSIGIEQLKAEVERLKAENEAVKLGNKEWRQTAIERGEMNAEDANAIGLLKAEVKRLTKAGDAMADELIQEYGREVCLKFGWFKGWNAAKGVQS